METHSPVWTHGLVSRFKSEHRIPLDSRLTAEETQRYKDWLVRNGHHSQALDEPRTLRDGQGDKLLSQLAPDWNRRRKLVQARMKTMLRIYLSKWFWVGLDWQEVELVQLLLERQPQLDLSFLTPQLLSQWIGQNWLSIQELEERQAGLYCIGSSALLIGDLPELVYSFQDYKAVWKLRSVQSMRDFLFVKVTGHEHEGKLGIHRNRIRGYRDGKGKAGDPTRIRWSLELDRLFWEEVHRKRWEDWDEDIRSQIRT